MKSYVQTSENCVKLVRPSGAGLATYIVDYAVYSQEEHKACMRCLYKSVYKSIDQYQRWSIEHTS